MGSRCVVRIGICAEGDESVARVTYLLIQPGWYFTKDGSKPLEGAVVGALSTRWGARERNGAAHRSGPSTRVDVGTIPREPTVSY